MKGNLIVILAKFVEINCKVYTNLLAVNALLILRSTPLWTPDRIGFSPKVEFTLWKLVPNNKTPQRKFIIAESVKLIIIKFQNCFQTKPHKKKLQNCHGIYFNHFPRKNQKLCKAQSKRVLLMHFAKIVFSFYLKLISFMKLNISSCIHPKTLTSQPQLISLQSLYIITRNIRTLPFICMSYNLKSENRPGRYFPSLKQFDQTRAFQFKAFPDGGVRDETRHLFFMDRISFNIWKEHLTIIQFYFFPFPRDLHGCLLCPSHLKFQVIQSAANQGMFRVYLAKSKLAHIPQNSEVITHYQLSSSSQKN